MLKIYHVFSIVVFLFVAVITHVNAQEPVVSTPTQQATVVANVNVYEPVIVSQESGVLTVGFDIANDAGVAQGDIKYGLDIVKVTTSGQTIVDSYVSPEVLALGAQTTVHKELIYSIPPTLSGEYEVWIVSRTTSGMMLGLGRAGKVLFTSTGPHVHILPETCLLTVSGETTTYSLYQGVDVAPEETVSFSCTLESRFETDVTLTPAFSTHKRTHFGEMVETEPVAIEPITLTAGEKRVVTLAIPKATIPQAYDVAVSLVNADMQTVSNKVIAHYVLRGESATIQTATLDNTSYAQGDTLSATIVWSPSADAFLNSRAGNGTALENTVLTLSVTDETGVPCIEPVTRSVRSDEQNITITAPVTSTCDTPTLAVTLADGAGTTLDSRVFAVPASSDVSSEGGYVTATGTANPLSGMTLFILVLTTVSTLMILYVLMTMRASLHKATDVKESSEGQ